MPPEHIPPYMLEVSLRVPVGLWRTFQAACEAHGTYPSDVLRHTMLSILEVWDAAETLEASARHPVPVFHPQPPTGD